MDTTNENEKQQKPGWSQMSRIKAETRQTVISAYEKAVHYVQASIEISAIFCELLITS